MMYEMKTPHNLRCSPVYNHTMPDAYNKKDGITYQMFDHTFTEEELKCDLEQFITVDLIRERFMTKAFCSFVYNYVPGVSSTKKIIWTRIGMQSARLHQDATTIFQLINSSDIAWAMTQVVNNDKAWVESFDNETAKADKKRKERENEVMASLAILQDTKRSRGSTSRRTTRKNSPQQDEESVNDDDSDSQEATEKDEEASKNSAPQTQRWAAPSNRRLQYNVGLNKTGRQFYRLFLKALKSVGESEWDVVWNDFWEEEEERWKSSNKKRIRPLQDDFGAEDVAYDFSDEEHEADTSFEDEEE